MSPTEPAARRNAPRERTDDPLQAPPDYTPWGTGPNGTDGEFEGSAQTGNLRLVHPLDFLQHCPDS